MYYKKIMKKVKYELDNYSIIDKRIENIERNRIGNNKDINSFIKSKNKISSSVEAEVINNIEIDKEIKMIKKWNKIIEKVFEEYKEENEIIYKIAEYKYKLNLTIEKIAELVYLSRKQIRNHLTTFSTEIAFMAIKNHLINL